MEDAKSNNSPSTTGTKQRLSSSDGEGGHLDYADETLSAETSKLADLSLQCNAEDFLERRDRSLSEADSFLDNGAKEKLAILNQVASNGSSGKAVYVPPPMKSYEEDKLLLTKDRKTRSLYGANPCAHFGPKGYMRRKDRVPVMVQDPANMVLTWCKPPMAVLIIKKHFDQTVIPPFLELVSWIIKEKSMIVVLEDKVIDEPHLHNNDEFKKLRKNIYTFREGEDLEDKVDMIICLGGDGTLLYASSLFQHSVPPVLAFHLGSLGFLTPTVFEDFRKEVTNVIEGKAKLMLRSRLECTVLKKEKYRIVPNDDCKPLLVLNDVVIDRGPSPYLCNIELYINEHMVTSVQGDGLIISTTTGSTAYAAAAGASMVHPNIPAILITPICPHSLSFRPIVIPAGVEVWIRVASDARNTVWAAFDGRGRHELQFGEILRIVTSIYPVPSICKKDHVSDWFDSLAGCLNWNVRKSQKSLTGFQSEPEMSNGEM